MRLEKSSSNDYIFTNQPLAQVNFAQPEGSSEKLECRFIKTSETRRKAKLKSLLFGMQILDVQKVDAFCETGFEWMFHGSAFQARAEPMEAALDCPTKEDSRQPV